MTIDKNGFIVQYRPNYVGQNGKKAQQVSIVMDRYKGTSQTRIMSMWESQFNNMMSCTNTSAMKGNRYGAPMSCQQPSCKVIARGKYSTGGKTDSNPVVFEFDDGQGKPDIIWKGEIAGGKIATLKYLTCEGALEKFKVGRK